MVWAAKLAGCPWPGPARLRIGSLNAAVTRAASRARPSSQHGLPSCATAIPSPPRPKKHSAPTPAPKPPPQYTETAMQQQPASLGLEVGEASPLLRRERPRARAPGLALLVHLHGHGVEARRPVNAVPSGCARAACETHKGARQVREGSAEEWDGVWAGRCRHLRGVRDRGSRAGYCQVRPCAPPVPARSKTHMHAHEHERARRRLQGRGASRTCRTLPGPWAGPSPPGLGHHGIRARPVARRVVLVPRRRRPGCGGGAAALVFRLCRRGRGRLQELVHLVLQLLVDGPDLRLRLAVGSRRLGLLCRMRDGALAPVTTPRAPRRPAVGRHAQQEQRRPLRRFVCCSSRSRAAARKLGAPPPRARPRADNAPFRDTPSAPPACGTVSGREQAGKQPSAGGMARTRHTRREGAGGRQGGVGWV